MRPVVGITTYVTPASWGYWELEAALIPADYVHAVERAGGRPLLVPPSSEGVDETLDAVDALILSGGADLDPESYGEQPHPETFGVHPERDAAELALVTRALDRDMPVLGICRGMQLLNVLRGGTLDQHLSDSIDVRPHRADDSTFGMHEVLTVPGSLVAGIVGERMTVHSHHHQGVDRVGEGLIASAHAHDGVVEAIEDSSRRFCLGVLWHPDADPVGAGAPLFTALVRAAAGLP
jgi:putative glutamine amidotransferase